MEIRRVTRKDLPSLIASMAQAEFFADRFKRQEEGRGVLLATWLDRAAVGDVYLWLEPAEEAAVRHHLPGVPLITHLEVHPDYRNRGIGSAILAKTEQTVRDRGHRQIALGVGLDNDGAIRLYERCGYQEWPHGTVKSPEDEFRIFVKEL